jgi:hypothetical protein
MRPWFRVCNTFPSVVVVNIVDMNHKLLDRPLADKVTIPCSAAEKVPFSGRFDKHSFHEEALKTSDPTVHKEALRRSIPVQEEGKAMCLQSSLDIRYDETDRLCKYKSMVFIKWRLGGIYWMEMLDRYAKRIRSMTC